jgi:hypothetical protein
MGVSGYNVPRCLGVLPQAPLHWAPTCHLLAIVARFAGPAEGCRSKARHASEVNELRFYAGSLLPPSALLDALPWPVRPLPGQGGLW